MTAILEKISTRGEIEVYTLDELREIIEVAYLRDYHGGSREAIRFLQMIFGFENECIEIQIPEFELWSEYTAHWYIVPKLWAELGLGDFDHTAIDSELTELEADTLWLEFGRQFVTASYLDTSKSWNQFFGFFQEVIEKSFLVCGTSGEGLINNPHIQRLFKALTGFDTFEDWADGLEPWHHIQIGSDQSLPGSERRKSLEWLRTAVAQNDSLYQSLKGDNRSWDIHDWDWYDQCWAGIQ